MISRWAEVEQLFDRLVTAPPEQRDALLAEARESDDIKADVRSLLQAHDRASGFLERSAVTDIPDLALARAAASATAVDELAPGQMLGPYVVKRVAGRGGMGIVYEAEDTRLHRRVALKAVPSGIAAEDAERVRLRHEARAAAALQHPNIAVVYALEEIDGRLFISSEYLDGQTLRAEMNAPMPIERALEIAATLARAVCAAHERGIVHRDLKPENVVRTGDGVLKVLDFGLAQFEAAASDLASRTRLTHQGMIVGTPAYMAPEQLLGRPTDFRVDQFAIGVLLYEMCVGRHPFGDGSLPSVIARILAADPEHPTPVTQVPPAAWAVIERCLAKDPERRFPSTRELVAALEDASRRLALGASFQPPSALSATTAASRPLGWWRFHQFAVALSYGGMVWPLWHAHRTLGEISRFIFFASLTVAVVAVTLRLHLLFSSRVYPEHLAEQRHRTALWILGADALFCLLLVAVGLALREQHAGWAALFIGAGVSSAIAFLFIEPATTRATFR